MRRQIGKTAVTIKALFMGKEGTRKSNTAIQIAEIPTLAGKERKVLLFDLEYKAIEGFNENYLAKHGVKFGNICEIRSRDMNLIQQIIDRILDGKPVPVIDENGKITKANEKDEDGNDFMPDSIIIDSISVIQDLMIEARQDMARIRTNQEIIDKALVGNKLELELDKTGIPLSDYNKMQSKALKLVRNLQAQTGIDVIYICRAIDAKESKLEDKKLVVIDLGYEKMDATSFRKFLPFEANLFVHMKNEANGVTTFNILKDSLGLHNKGEILTEFSLLEYSDIMNNKAKDQYFKASKYENDIQNSKAFTDDDNKGDIKAQLYLSVIKACQKDASKKAQLMEYCKSNNIADMSSAEKLEIENLMEMKELLDIK